VLAQLRTGKLMVRQKPGPKNAPDSNQLPKSNIGSRYQRPSNIAFKTRAQQLCISVLTFAGDFGEDKLLGQAKCNMDAHVGPEISGYKPRTAIRSWVVGVGK
jgi:hypothetical protein